MAREPFGTRLRSLRERAGMTRTQLADMTGIDHRYLSAWERNEAVPEKLVIIERLATALEMSAVELMAGRPGNSPKQTIRLTANNFADHLSTDYAATLVKDFTVPADGIHQDDWIVSKFLAWLERENARLWDVHYEMSRHVVAVLLERLASRR